MVQRPVHRSDQEPAQRPAQECAREEAGAGDSPREQGGPQARFPNTADYYPPTSRRMGESGAATIEVCVDAGGRLTADPTLEASSGSARLISRTVTNDDGRTERPLIAEQPIPIAQYELRFGIGDYFARYATPTADPPFLGVVPIRFAVAEPEAHYHVPLLVTPWSYSTYRGS